MISVWPCAWRTIVLLNFRDISQNVHAICYIYLQYLPIYFLYIYVHVVQFKQHGHYKVTWNIFFECCLQHTSTCVTSVCSNWMLHSVIQRLVVIIQRILFLLKIYWEPKVWKCVFYWTYNINRLPSGIKDYPTK